MKYRIKVIGKVTAGIILLIIGLIGLLIPVMPQWPFIIPGLMLLADHFHPARRLLNWLQKKLERYKFSRTPPSAKMEDRPDLP